MVIPQIIQIRMNRLKAKVTCGSLMLGNPHLATNPPAPKVPERGSFGVKRMIEWTISWYSFSCGGKNIINYSFMFYLYIEVINASKLFTEPVYIISFNINHISRF